MSADILEDVKHSRPQPPEWDELVEFSRSALELQTYPERTTKGTELLLGRLACIDNERFTEIRYYGIGLIMCGIARALRDPDVRNESIRVTGKLLFERWVTEGTVDRPNLQPSDASRLMSSAAFGRIAMEAGESLSPEIQFLNDALELEKRNRISKVRNPESRHHPRRYPNINYDENDLLRVGLSAENVGKQTTAAASSVYNYALQARYRKRKSKPHSNIEQDGSLSPTVAEIINDGGIEPLNLDTVGPQCSTLRIDEFKINLEDYIDTDDKGNIIFRRDRRIPQRDLEPHDNSKDDVVVLHVKRHRCPAQFVEGLIEVIMDIVPAATNIAIAMAKVRDDYIKSLGTQSQQRSFPADPYREMDISSRSLMICEF